MTTLTRLEKNQAPKEQDEAAAAPAPAPAIKEGDEVMLSGVFGKIINPFSGDEFDQGKITKVTVDNWTLVQFEHGKLALA